MATCPRGGVQVEVREGRVGGRLPPNSRMSLACGSTSPRHEVLSLCTCPSLCPHPPLFLRMPVILF